MWSFHWYARTGPVSSIFFFCAIDFGINITELSLRWRTQKLWSLILKNPWHQRFLPMRLNQVRMQLCMLRPLTKILLFQLMLSEFIQLHFDAVFFKHNSAWVLVSGSDFLPVIWCTFCLDLKHFLPVTLCTPCLWFDVLCLWYSLPVIWCILCLCFDILFACDLMYSLSVIWCTFCLWFDALLACDLMYSLYLWFAALFLPITSILTSIHGGYYTIIIVPIAHAVFSRS